MTTKRERETAKNELYVAEKLGALSEGLEGIKKDLQELKDAIIPLRRRVYWISGGVSAVALIITIISQSIFRSFVGH